MQLQNIYDKVILRGIYLAAEITLYNKKKVDAYSVNRFIAIRQFLLFAHKNNLSPCNSR